MTRRRRWRGWSVVISEDGVVGASNVEFEVKGELGF